MQEKQVLQCKSAKSTMARFSKLSNPTKTHEKLNGPLADNSNSGSFIIVPKHNDMIAEEAFSFACQHSIDLIDLIDIK